MRHALDNPIWNALISGNNSLSLGTDAVKFFAHDVAPFIGMESYDEAHMLLLQKHAPAGRNLVIFSDQEVTFPGGLDVLEYIETYQMVYEMEKLPDIGAYELKDLSAVHVPQMLTLTALTKPGPFFLHTIDFGHYEGIFESDQLVAMAGYRLHPDNFVEISAVCTHPAAQGHGYAGALLASRIRHIKAYGGTPFLHVKTDNERAISRYLQTGFTTRKLIHIYLFSKR